MWPSPTLQMQMIYSVPTVNLCAKINRYAEPNTMVIGGDLYLVLKSIPVLKNDYYLKQVGFYSLGIRASYPLYSVTSKYEKPAIGDFMQIPELRPVGPSMDAAFMSSSRAQRLAVQSLKH